MAIRTLTRALTASLAAVGTVAALGLATAPVHAAGRALNYVALGDSYSAGSGVLPLDLSASPLCARSTANYPHIVAAAIGANFTDATCGGAQTKDFAGSQYPGVAPQLNAVHADTDLVTLTIGGNDSNTFISAILACGSAGIVTLGFGHPCQTLYGSSFDNTIDTSTYPAVKAALQAVHAKAPNARIAVLGYPWIVPAQAVAGCYAKMPVASGDIPYRRDLRGPRRGIERARRVPADRDPVDRADPVRDQLRAGASERAGRGEDGDADDGCAGPALSTPPLVVSPGYSGKSSTVAANSSLRHGQTSPQVQNIGPAAPSPSRTTTRRWTAKRAPTSER
jgi:lysophospholipase L1-like esterase